MIHGGSPCVCPPCVCVCVHSNFLIHSQYPPASGKPDIGVGCGLVAGLVATVYLGAFCRVRSSPSCVYVCECVLICVNVSE